MALKELIVQYTANAQPLINTLNQIDSRLMITARSLDTVGQKFRNMGKDISLYISAPIGVLGLNALRVQAEFQSLEGTLTSVLDKFKGNRDIQTAVADEMSFLRSTADELGVSLQAIQRPYVQYLASSNDSLEVTRKTIRAYLGLSVALGLTGPATELAIKALSQMQSKGKITAEELRGQLGDSVPGAVAIFASAMGKTIPEFTKAMEQGNISADVIAKTADIIENKYAAAIEKSSNGIRANFNRVGNAVFHFNQVLGEAEGEVFGVTSILAKFATWLNKVADDFARLDKEGQTVILTIGFILGVIGPLVLALGILFKVIAIGVGILSTLWTVMKGVVVVFRAFAIALAANPLGAFLLATTLIIVYWKEIVQLFKDAYEWLNKLSGGVIGKAVGFITNTLAGKNATQYPGQNASVYSKQSGFFNGNTAAGTSINNTSSKNNVINMSFAPGTSAADQNVIQQAVRKVLQEQNRESYYEMAVI